MYVTKAINVSKYDDVTSQAQQRNQWKQHLKKCVLKRLQKTGSDCTDVTWCGGLFQIRAAATEKAQYSDSCNSNSSTSSSSS